MKKVAVTVEHRNAAAELTLRALDGEPMCCDRHFRMFVDELAKLLAQGKTVMLRRDGPGMQVKVLSQ